MMGWRVACVSVLLCGEVLSRPSLLGAAPGSSDHHAHGDHHEDHHEDHHSGGNEHHQEVSQNVDYNNYEYDYDLPEQARSQDSEDYYYDENPDKSYAFQFAGDTYSRDETAQADGSVKGSYSYTGGDGVERTVNYRAGAGIGFEVIDPEIDQMFASFGQKMETSPLAVNFAPPPQAAPSVRNTAITQPDSLYGAPPLPSYGEEPIPSYEAEPIPSPSVSSVQSAGMMMDPSYYFEYKSADGERTEDADSSGVVTGSYKYRTAGGTDIEVRYRAGADTGFVVENMDELTAALKSAAAEAPLVKTPSQIDSVILEAPTPLSGAPPAPQVDSLFPAEESDYFYEAPAEQLDTLYAAPAPLPSYEPEVLPAPLPSYEPEVLPAPLPSYEPEVLPAPSIISAKIVPAGMMMMDPSYNFAYSGEDSGREENADSNGVVQGQYSYTNAEGNEISVRYRAGAGIGFVIENEEELNAAVRKATDDGAVVAAARRAESKQESASEVFNSYAPPDASPLPLAAPDSLYGAPSEPEPEIALPLPAYNEPSQPDTLYGAPSEPEPEIALPLPLSAPDSLYGAPSEPEPEIALPLPAYNEPSQPDTLYGAPSESLPTRDLPAAMVMDASFNFNIEGPDHSFQEEADQAGERTGSYSYISPGGESIEVRYRAGRDGFVILNPDQVLPRAPVA